MFYILLNSAFRKKQKAKKPNFFFVYKNYQKRKFS